MTRNDDGSLTLPIVEERLVVDKRVVEGRVRVSTVVDHEDVMLRENLVRTSVDVERVPVGREVESAPAMREQGDYLIIPIVEERVVVEKRLFLVEEVRVRRTTHNDAVDVPATRRVMRAVVERDTDTAT